jgi:tyrosine-protein phosphatase YwqE
MGYRKVITTPHIMQDFYNNEPADILGGLEILREKVKDAGLDMEVEAAAEYYLDESLLKKLEQPEKILTFGNKYLLFETSFINKPMYLDDFLFQAMSKGFQPVMAHPERYAFVHNEPDLLKSLTDRGMLLQINMNSLSGYYSKQVQKMARQLIDQKQIHFLGSDCHSIKHFEAMVEAMRTPHYERACALPLLNYSL